MKFQTNPSPFLVALLVCVASANVGLSMQAGADANNSDLASVGLVVHWQSNIGGAPLANGAQSFVIWSHTKEKREYVTVRNAPREHNRIVIKSEVLGLPVGSIGVVTKVIQDGARFEVEFEDAKGKVLGSSTMDAKDVSPVDTRIIERIRGEEIDLIALNYSISNGEKLAKPPRLGLDGAKKKAEKLVGTYQTLGRKLDVEEYSQQLVYAVSLTTNGIVECMDAETGGVIWRTEAGKSSLPMFGPGVSDDYVVVTNGSTLYVYELATGNIVTTRKLIATPTACPTVLQDKAIVPSVDGRLVAYDIRDPLTAPAVLRCGTENRLGMTISANHQFMSWPTGNRLVMAKMDKVPSLWNNISINEPIYSLSVATQKGFLTSTVAGTVFHCSTGRDDSLLWKSRLAVQVSKSPLVNKDLGFVLSDEGFLFALNLTDGVDAWGHQPNNVRNLVAVGKKHVYAQDSRKSLVVFDLTTGIESGRTNLILPDVIPNSVNDRLLFVTKQGQVTCLREIDATSPTFATVFSGETIAPAKPSKPEATPAKAIEEDMNIFGGAGAAETEDIFKNP